MNLLKKLFSRKNIEHTIPTIHFLLTFVWERLIFVFHNNWDISALVAKTNTPSKNTELILVYCLTKVFAFVIIFSFWKLVFLIVNHKIPRDILRNLTIVFIIGVLIALFCYPEIFGFYEKDNYVNYLESTRFLPTYWQSIYTGAWYGGCMMFLPHPFSIILVQWILSVSVLGYIIYQLGKTFNIGNCKYLVLCVFLIPETHRIVFNPYRNCIYTILCVFYISILLFNAINKNKFTFKQMILLSLFSAFIMVWRGEGIFIGIGGIVFSFIFNYKLKIKKALLIVLVFVIAFLSFTSIQNIGSHKYYGNDYSIINTLYPLNQVFNNPQANLKYEGSKSDLDNIEKVVPIQVIKQYGKAGYRNYNWTKGNKDFNQSLANSKTSDAYMSSYYNILLHNMSTFINLKSNIFAISLLLPHRAYFKYYLYTDKTNYPIKKFVYDKNVKGKKELKSTFVTPLFDNLKIRKKISNVYLRFIRKTTTSYQWNSQGATGLPFLPISITEALLHLLSLILTALIGIIELVKLIARKTDKKPYYIILSIMLSATSFAIFVASPEEKPVYWYTVFYSGYFVVASYFIERKITKKMNKN